VWNSTFWTVLGCELAVLVIAFTLPFFTAARRRDFI
jgi:ABC-2 type transport system permease protein